MTSVLLVVFLSALALDGGSDLGASSGNPTLPTLDAGQAGADADHDGADAHTTPNGEDGGSAAQGASAPAAAPAASLVKVEGRILVKGTRQPLPGALIHLAVGDGTSTSTESAGSGSFALEVLPGTHSLRVQCPGYIPVLRSLTVPLTTQLLIRLEPRSVGERYETVVTADPQEEPMVSLKKEELIHTAGSFGDPFRVVESLPGVAQTTWPLPLYAIRGANPGNTGFFIDGVRAPALFHFALGPSVIHPFFIESLEFFPGGYPIDYGRYVSGIVTAQTAAPATDRVHVSADIRLFDAGGIVAAPWDHGKGTIAAAGRYSYTGLLLSAFSNAYALDYWDYQLRIEHPLGPGKLTLFAFGSGDHLQQKNPDVTDWGFVGKPNAIAPGLANLTFHRAQLRWAGAVAGGHLTVATVAGVDDSTVSLTSLFSLPVGSRSYSLSPRIVENWSLLRWLDLELGSDAELQRFKPVSLVALSGGFLADNYETDLFHDRDVLSVGAYAGFTLRGGERLIISPGLRYDAYYEQGVHRFAPGPRLLVRYRVAPHHWIKATVGQFSQMPSLPVGVPGFESFGLAKYGLQRSQQGSLGIESALEELLGIDVNVDTSIYYQRLHLTDLKNSLIPDPETPDLLEPREGESYGWELMLRRPMKHKLYGWLAYTLSRSLRLVDGIVVPADWEQRHIVNLVVGYRWPRNYSTSARFHYNSGRPYPLYDDATHSVDGYIHLPGFPQLDLRGDKRFIFDNYVMDVYLELVNATDSREVFDVKRSPAGSINENYYRLVLPSAGVHIEW